MTSKLRARQRRQQSKKTARNRGNSRRLAAEFLEERRMLATTVFSESFESGAFGSNWAWTSWSSVQRENESTSTFDSYAHPQNADGSYAANLTGGYKFASFVQTGIQTKDLNLSSYRSATLTFKVQQGGTGDSPEAGDDLVIRYRKADGSFVTLSTLNYATIPSSSFKAITLTLPPAAIHSNTAIFFDSTASDTRYYFSSYRQQDNWFIDNVKIVANRRPDISISGPSGYFEDDGLPYNIGWSASDPDGDSVSVSATLRLDGAVIATSNSQNGSFLIDGSQGIGYYQLDVSATDGTDSASVIVGRTINDDDEDGPTIEITGSSGSETAGLEQNFSWSIDDTSGSESTVSITRNGELIFTRSYDANVSSDSFNFDSYGIGSYQINIEATDQDNDRTSDQSSSAKSRVVNVLNTLPVGDIEIVTAESAWLEGNQIEFSATGSSDADGDPLTYLWDFGNGQLVTGEKVKHTFVDDGVFDVKVIVVDAYGGVAEQTKSITIANVIPELTVGSFNSPVEAATFLLPVNLSDPGTDSTTARIDWGDGTQSIATQTGSVEHIYSVGGSLHTIVITLEDEDGNYGEVFRQDIMVHDAAPVLRADNTFVTGEANQQLTFEVMALDGVSDTLTYQWDFGDGTVLSGPDLHTIDHAYSNDGFYAVLLTVTDSDSLVSTLEYTAAVGVPVSFATEITQVSENTGEVQIIVELENGTPAESDLTIPFNVAGDLDSSEFAITQTSVVIPEGKTQGVISVSLNEDDLSEGVENLVLSLAGTNATSVGIKSTHTIEVADNDPLPTVFFTSKAQIVEEDAGTVTIWASLDKVSGQDVSIPLIYSGKTDENDFSSPVPSQLIVPAGSMTGSFDIQIKDDNVTELAESIIVTMGQPIGAVTSLESSEPSVATVIISQNDAPVIFLDSAYRVTSEDVETLFVRARLSRISDTEISIPYVVAGTATNGADYHLLSGSLLFSPGRLEASIQVNIVDDNIREDIENFIVTLQPTDGVQLGTTQSVLTDILDNDISRVSFDVEKAKAYEGEVYQVSVSLDKPSDSEVTVPFVVTGTSNDGSDYTISESIITFAPLQTSFTFDITLNEDEVNEPPEQLFIDLGTPVGAERGDLTSFALDVADNDPLIDLLQDEKSISESDGTTKLLITLSAPSNKPIVVPITYSGTAKRNSDFTAPTQVIIPAFATSATLLVSITDDQEVEATESLYVRLSSPTSGGGILEGTPFASLSVRDNDELPRVFWKNTSQLVGEGSDNAKLKLYLSHASTDPIVVGLGYSQESARIGIDFRPVFNSVTFAPGQTSLDVLVPLIDDDLKEALKRFSVNLDSASNALLPVDPALRRSQVRLIDNDQLSSTAIANLNTQVENEINNGQFSHAANELDKLLTRSGANRDIDEIIQAVEIASTFLPPPFNVITNITAHTINYLGDKYPDPNAVLGIDGPAVNADFNSDPWKFSRELLKEIGKDLILDNLGSHLEKLFGTGIEFLGAKLDSILAGGTVAIGDLIGENVTLDDVKRELQNAGEWIEDVGESLKASVPEQVKKLTWKKVFGGYPEGTTVFFDVDFNGIRTEHEPLGSADSDGNVLVFGSEIADVNGNDILDPNEGQWVTIGGIDTSVNLPFKIPFTSPSNFVTTTPTSTLITKLVVDGHFPLDLEGVRDSEARYLDAIGVTDVSSVDFDFLSQAINGNVAAGRMFLLDTEVYNTVIELASLFHGAESTLSLSLFADLAFSDIAEKIASESSNLDLTKTSVIRSVIQGVSVRSGVNLSTEVIEASTAVIADLNGLAREIAVPVGVSYVEGIVTIQKVLQTKVSDDLADFASGLITAEDFSARTTRTEIESVVSNATIGNILPVYVMVSDAFVEEGDGITQLVFDVTPLTIASSNLPITVNYRTDGLTALAGLDYEENVGQLQWDPGDLESKQITVNVFSDTIPEGTESISLILDSVTNAVLYRDLALGTIEDRDLPEIDVTSNSLEDIVYVSVTSEGILVNNGEDLFGGYLPADSSITILGDPQDQVAFFASDSTDFVWTEDAAGMRTLQIDNATFHLGQNIQTVGSIIADLILPKGILAGTEEYFGIDIPDTFDDGNLSFQWKVTQGDATLIDSTESSFDLTINEAGFVTVDLQITDGLQSFHLSRVIAVDEMTVDASTVWSYESETVVNSGRYNPSANAELQASIGEVTDNGDGTWSWSFAPSDGPVDSDVVQISLLVDGTQTSLVSFQMIVANASPAPTIESISDVRVVGNEIVVMTSATDLAGVNDELTFSYQVFALGNQDVVAEGSGVEMTEFRFTPPAADQYAVRLTVSDEDGGSSSTEQRIFVIGASYSELRLVSETNLPVGTSQQTADDEQAIFNEWQDVPAQLWITINEDLFEQIIDLEFTLTTKSGWFEEPIFLSSLGSGSSVLTEAQSSETIFRLSLTGVDFTGFQLGERVLIANLLVPVDRENGVGVPMEIIGEYPSPGSADAILLKETKRVNNEQHLLIVSDHRGSFLPVIYDTNDDGRIGLGDFAGLIRNYGKQPGVDEPDAYRFDYDQSGRIDLSDFALFVRNYGRRKDSSSGDILQARVLAESRISAPRLTFEGEPEQDSATSVLSYAHVSEYFNADVYDYDSQPNIEEIELVSDSSEQLDRVPLTTTNLDPRIIDAVFSDDDLPVNAEIEDDHQFDALSIDWFFD
ncbi:Calx-beta domain-containing protein [Bremerella sp. P1]|uniref:Calx-beta domain-containing protein n=1 Tax=Bremerella sp. P1 TaxID=3026424 RepID=UPI002367534A|nr:Calx-beta domain-containing protein [Bremerella sp. P1]WDI41524.1 Calx-beta domain-containing protein [Bremerella sp. P1]